MEGSDAKYSRQGEGMRHKHCYFDPRPLGKSEMTHGSASRIAASPFRAFLCLLACATLLGSCPAFNAPQKDSKAAAAPQGKKPHPPLLGKACVECHKQEVASTVRCLVAKEPMCVLCHDIPDAGGVSRLLSSDNPICFKCHAKEKFKGSFKHGPFVFGACVACHDPHGGKEPRMLRISGRQLCLTCHRDMDARFTNARFRHSALANGCTDCHSPHSSEQRYELIASVPVLCAKCHEKTLQDQKMAVVKHSPVTETPFCLNCHNPHLAESDHLLPSDEMDTCLKCHDDPIKVGQDELERIGQLLAVNPMHHGPIQSKECSGCHKPHGSPYFRLLTNQYPKDFYAPFFVSNYDLCFRCHDAALATEEHTTSKTGFRNGDRNLHFIHVNKTSHGRTCRACHETHASTTPELIGATVSFGNWKLPVNFEKAESGGSCAPGCHAKQKYERKSK